MISHLTISRAATSIVLGISAGLTIIFVLALALRLALNQLRNINRSEQLGVGGLILGITIVKLALLFVFHGVAVDVNTYQAWALKIASSDPSHTYEPGYFLDYPPGYLYVLWFAGSLARLFSLSGDTLRVLVETPPIIADALIGLVIFGWVRIRYGFGQALIATLVYLANPGLAFDTVVWGQTDSVPTLFMLLALLMAIAAQYELSLTLGAIASLMKPQGLFMIPLLVCWIVLRAPSVTLIRAMLCALGTSILVVAPFQIGHPVSWIYSLYHSTAAYYHETSVNAYNLMALLGGLRQPDAYQFLGVSYFAWGLMLALLWYAFVGFLVSRTPDDKTLLLGAFLVCFGSFMLLTRMHERYLYPALVFLVLIALEDDIAMTVLGILSATYLFNLYQVAFILNNRTFLEVREPSAMMAAAINTAVMVLFTIHVIRDKWHRESSDALPVVTSADDQADDAVTERRCSTPYEALSWNKSDWFATVALTLFAAAVRFWRLNSPPEIVFDEVHFVTQARHYIHGEPFLDPHPPLAKLIIAAGILLFGDKPWAWRFGNAVLGTALVCITYLLARRMFNRRLPALLAGLFVQLDGFFLVDSRVAVIDIVYLTFAAWSYLFLFRFVQSKDWCDRRRTLLWLGVTLGLCLGSKLYVPAATFLLVTGFLLHDCYKTVCTKDLSNNGPLRYLIGAFALVFGTSATIYLLVFLPHFLLGWWRGFEDLIAYYKGVIWYERSVYHATHPYSAPWWSWPLMLRPIAYWQNFPNRGNVAVIWGAGNPILWWGALSAIVATAGTKSRQRNLADTFILVGYFVYLAIWVPIGRTLFLYHYMPAVYLGFLALASLLTECWEGRAEGWTHAAIILPTLAACALGLPPVAKVLMVAAILTGYVAVHDLYPDKVGRYVVLVFLLSAFLAFAYFFPVWTAMPISRGAYYARMWVEGHGLANWI